MFKIEARTDAAVRRHDDVVAETVSLIKTRADALLRRFDAFEARERQRRKDAERKRKADEEAAIQRKIDAHSDPRRPNVVGRVDDQGSAGTQGSRGAARSDCRRRFRRPTRSRREAAAPGRDRQEWAVASAIR
jgi:hypothetical protein